LILNKFNIISAHSPALIDLFQAHNFDRVSETKLKISGVKISAMKVILDFIYEGKVNVDSANAIKVLNAAKKFKIGGLEKQIMENAKEYLSIENFIGFYVATKDEMWKEKTAEVLEFMIRFFFIFLVNCQMSLLFSFLQELGWDAKITKLEHNLHGANST
jgi:hypothetical protein